ncbi:MAG: hypothetical protein KAU17_11230 [Spirochaetales bacterium]|nr:hypothetical protein [Spirochaetales bacterium]
MATMSGVIWVIFAENKHAPRSRVNFRGIAYALSWAPVGTVTTLMQMSPVMLLPIDRFVLKKRIPPGVVGGTIVAIAGAAFLFILA